MLARSSPSATLQYAVVFSSYCTVLHCAVLRAVVGGGVCELSPQLVHLLAQVQHFQQQRAVSLARALAVLHAQQRQLQHSRAAAGERNQVSSEPRDRQQRCTASSTECSRRYGLLHRLVSALGLYQVQRSGVRVFERAVREVDLSAERLRHAAHTLTRTQPAATGEELSGERLLQPSSSRWQRERAVAM